MLALHLTLCLIALAPTTIFAAPVGTQTSSAHKKVTPPPAANQNTGKSPATAKLVPSPTVGVLPTITTVVTPTATNLVDGNGLPVAGGPGGPNIVTVDNDPSTGVHIPTVHGRSADLAAAIALASSDVAAPGPITLPVTDKSGEDAHFAPAVVKARNADVVSSLGDIIPPPPRAITTEDDNPNCASNRGGCNLHGG